MFSSPLPYTRPDDRYAQPLPPPVPPSPLRRHAQTYDARQPIPPLNHTTSAPGDLGHAQPTFSGWTTADASQSPRPIEDDASAMDAAFRRSLSLHSPPVPGESEAERMVRMMSRTGRRSFGHGSPVPMYEYHQQEEAFHTVEEVTSPFQPMSSFVEPDAGQYRWENGYGPAQGAYQYQQYPAYESGAQQYPSAMDAHGSMECPTQPPASSSRPYSYEPSIRHASQQPVQQPAQQPASETTPQPTPTSLPPPHAKPGPSLPSSYGYTESATNSGTATPCPPYLATPAIGETSYLDAIPFEPPPPIPEKRRTPRPSSGSDTHGGTAPVAGSSTGLDPAGGPPNAGVRMPRGEDYASIPSYGAYDSDDSEDEYEPEHVVRGASTGGEAHRTSDTDRRASADEEQRASADAQRRASVDAERRASADVHGARPGEGVHRSGTVASRVSYSVGDEAGMTAPVVPPKDVVVDANEAQEEPKERKTLVFSYHPLPDASETAAPVPPGSTLPPQVKLFLAPTSFQLLSTSLKRLLADLMISASTLFIPSASAYAASEQERPGWRVEVWVRTFALPVPLGQGRRIVGGGFRTMVGLEMDEITPGGRPAVHARLSSSSSLTLTRTRSSLPPVMEAVPVVPKKPVATTQDATNGLVPAFASSYVLRLRLTNPLQVPFTAAQLVETLHRHYKYGQRISRSSTASVAPGTVEENAYSFCKMVDRAPGPMDEVTRLSKAHKLGKTVGGVPLVREEDREDIQGQVGRKGFRYTVRKAVSKAVGAVQSEREETVEDDRANWVTPFTG